MEKRLILEGYLSGRAPMPPRTVQIDWTDRCNADCFFCSQRDVRSGRELSLDVLLSIFDEMELMGVRSVDLSGGGDPLVHPDLRRLLDEITARSFCVGTLSTNGIGLRPRLIGPLLDAVGDQITVSLNFGDPPGYAGAMHLNESNWHRVVETVEELVKARNLRDAALPRVAIQFLVYDHTWPQMPDMLELAKSLGVDLVAFNPLLFHDELSAELRAHSAEFMAVTEEVLKRDERGIIADIRTVHPDINAAVSELRARITPDRHRRARRAAALHSKLRTFCVLPWFHLRIDPGGDILPCCALGPPDYPPLGTIKRSTLIETWTGGRFSAVRRGMSKFLAETRGGSADPAAGCGLPLTCTTYGACFLRALPYLHDTPFALALDSLGRSLPDFDLCLDGVLQQGVVSGLSAVVPPETAPNALDALVDGVRRASMAREGERLVVTGRTDDLEPGFHLLEAIEPNGRLAAARMIEKVFPGDPVDTPANPIPVSKLLRSGLVERLGPFTRFKGAATAFDDRNHPTDRATRAALHHWRGKRSRCPRG